MKVHGAILSPFVRKVLITLEIKGLAYEREDVFPGSIPPEFLKISPLGKIPAFEDGELSIADSTVICEYLEEQYPEITLRPEDPASRSKSRWIEEYADTKLVELCAGGIFFQRFVRPALFQEQSDESIVENTINNLLPPVQDYLESLVPEQGFFFGGMGLADVCLTSPFINAEYAGYQVDSSRWPKLAAFMERVKAHPVVSQRLVEEAEMMAAFG